MMAKKHVWRIKKEYFCQLKNGEKKLEVRVGYSAVKKVKEGDSISFENYGKNSFYVERISVYDSFSRMLEIEQVNDVLPGMTKQGALKVLKDIYPSDKEKLGVYVFELANRKKDNNENKFIYQVLSEAFGAFLSKIRPWNIFRRKRNHCLQMQWQSGGCYFSEER